MNYKLIADAMKTLRVCLWLSFGVSLAAGFSAAGEKIEYVKEPTLIGLTILFGIGALVLYVIFLVKANQSLKTLETEFRKGATNG